MKLAATKCFEGLFKLMFFSTPETLSNAQNKKTVKMRSPCHAETFHLFFIYLMLIACLFYFGGKYIMFVYMRPSFNKMYN